MLFKMFESYDPSKNKQITRESFAKLFKQLQADEADLGKVPSCTEEHFLSLFDALKGPQEDEKEEGVTYNNQPGKISRIDFETICFQLNWRRIERN